MGGSTAFAILALQLVTALDGPTLGAFGPPQEGERGPAAERPSDHAAAGPAGPRSWLLLRRSGREPAIAGAAPAPRSPQ